MSLNSPPPVPELQPHQHPTARRLQAAFMRASRYRTRSAIGRLVRSPLRVAITRAANMIESRAHWSVPAGTKTFWGARMRIRLPEPISNQLLGYGMFEPRLTAIMLSILNPGDTVVDIGAHYGYFTLLAAELVGVDGQVHAFEPTPSTFEILARNTRKHANVVANDVAVWSDREDVVITDLGPRLSAFNSIYTPRLDQTTRPTATRVSVPAVSLDEYCAAHALRPTFVKVDAESAESHILEGMRWVLSDPRPFVTLEVGDFDLPDVPASSQLVRSMTSNGYVAFEHGDDGIRVHRPPDTYGYDNLLFGPSEHPIVELILRHDIGRRVR